MNKHSFLVCRVRCARAAQGRATAQRKMMKKQRKTRGEKSRLWTNVVPTGAEDYNLMPRKMNEQYDVMHTSIWALERPIFSYCCCCCCFFLPFLIRVRDVRAQIFLFVGLCCYALFLLSSRSYYLYCMARPGKFRLQELYLMDV